MKNKTVVYKCSAGWNITRKNMNVKTYWYKKNKRWS